MLRLVRYYLLITTGFAVVIAILIGIHRHDMLGQLVRFAEQENKDLARLFLNTIWPQYEEHVAAASSLPERVLANHPRTQQLRQDLATLAAGLPILKAKIYDSQGVTVFSTNEREIGALIKNNLGYASAMQGMAASKLTYSDSLSAFSHLDETRDLVESYIPIKSAQGTAVGVFELYTDVTPLLADVKSHTTKLAVRSVTVFSLLYLALLFLVRRAERTIQAQYDDITNKNTALEREVRERVQAEDALRKAHDELEERVAARTRELTLEVNERKQAEESLRKLSLAVEQSPAMTLITDAQGAIEYVNPRFSQVTGYELADVIHRTPRILKSGKTPPEVYAILWQTISSGREWRGELRNRKKDGELFWVSASISPITDQNNHITHYLGVSEDVTARKKIEAEAREHRSQLAHVGRVSVMGEMSTTLAHELNQPLTVISGTAQLALSNIDGQDHAACRNALQQIAEQAGRAEEIVRRVRNFVKKTESELQLTDLNSVVRGAVNLVRVDAHEHGVDIRLKLGSHLPPVHADRIQIEQVLLNLVHNAVEAMKELRAHQRFVTITTRLRSSDLVETLVHNPGPAILEADMKRLFDPFMTTKDHGLGMGLSIARSIVEAHGGRIWACSTVETGTLFGFTLPVAEKGET